MRINFADLPRANIQVDAGSYQGSFEGWRHSIGQGAVNSLPLPERVVAGMRKLKPRLIRIFLQEFFNIYPDHGVFNWDKLDPYMDSLAQTGAQLLATINLKPPVLYPEINHDLWRPTDVAEWQNLIFQLVRRYSVEKPIVTYWEHVNEPDIGEWGGCPYRIPGVEELHEFYALTIRPILEAFPGARVGGPCPADYRIAPEFMDCCAKHRTPLDFVSYHRYDDDPESHRRIAEVLSEKIKSFPGKRPELILDEWSKGFEAPYTSIPYDAVSVDEMAMQSRRAAHLARIVLTLMETPLDWSFFFLLWDNCMYNDEFKTFFSSEGAKNVMYKHWNEAPHRFGLFSESGKVRPQYFVYQMLSQMGEQKLAAHCEHPDIKAIAVQGDGRLSVLIVNFNLQASHDMLVKTCFNNLQPGLRRLKAYRIDDNQRWSEDTLVLYPYEERTVDVLPEFEYQFYSPADSVLWVTLEDVGDRSSK